ncbi:tRNA (adenosine(37)-N6)-threonylcarbamoyltransferase complex dimerization subunit type 1 TsaB [Amnibacterium flavum]|uniref:tRNA (Adenosine(37)-N6)-threonylcarbamoyltransferase complex dimerization subunit type 1 TsaB n=1 Tax=Amnibacterium flavum TaxID=2173173 RepID=A0A2V1HWX2_9MICO|nr:tRNA (adenosine(37)-N6)-threonylcarbamoyltransferase complex dimerization subunit type 1 TsaB [Amnibacterium flavum]PVZ95057.1 tRNA (adenosine(37)-N6)-threonylcarbamoyltransferase complex dimerization subunit type 1 TsaB [Amnibacterium flavum]
MLLAIDSSAGTSVAVVDADYGVLAERTVTDGMSHAEVIGDLLRDVLAESGASVSALAAVAIGVGPGPFTGLRVGMAAGRAFAIAAGKPLLGVVSHDAIALEHYASGGWGELLVATDARRRELYWSRYSGLDEAGLPLRTSGPSVSAPDEVPASSRRIDATAVSAASLGLLAERLRRTGRATPTEPLYLRSPDVTLSSPKRVSR